MKLSRICMRTLHVQAGRLAIVSGETALESVYDSATAEQVLRRSHIGVAQRLRAFTSVKVCPFRGNQ
jgi:hypothetical protein